MCNIYIFNLLSEMLFDGFVRDVFVSVGRSIET